MFTGIKRGREGRHKEWKEDKNLGMSKLSGHLFIRWPTTSVLRIPSITPPLKKLQQQVNSTDIPYHP